MPLQWKKCFLCFQNRRASATTDMREKAKARLRQFAPATRWSQESGSTKPSLRLNCVPVFSLVLSNRGAKKASSLACISSTHLAWHRLIVHARVCSQRRRAGGQFNCDKRRRLKQKHAGAIEEGTKRKHLVLGGKFVNRRIKEKPLCPLHGHGAYINICDCFCLSSQLLSHLNNNDTGVVCTLNTKQMHTRPGIPPYLFAPSILLVLKLELFPIGIRSKGDTQLRRGPYRAQLLHRPTRGKKETWFPRGKMALSLFLVLVLFSWIAPSLSLAASDLQWRRRIASLDY